MSRFTAHLGLTLIEDDYGRPLTKSGRCQWRIATPLTYEVGAEGSGEIIAVPIGFSTDLASIPSAVSAFLPPDGPWAKAAVVHDWLYARAGLLPSRHYSRKEADKILREAMKVVGVPPWQRFVIYAAVRAVGARAWALPRRREPS